MIVYVDIDDTICYYVDGNKCDYNLALPYPNKIRTINDLYDNGHTIVYWTARGTVSGLDFTEITKTQLQEWGCKYNKLMLHSHKIKFMINQVKFNYMAKYEFEFENFIKKSF